MTRLTAQSLEPSVETVKLLCTDRGRHPAILLGFSVAYVALRLDPETGQSVSTPAARRFTSFKRGLEIVAAPDGHHTVHIRCHHPRCRRHVEWRAEHAAEVIDRLIAADMAELDISRA